MRYYKKFIPSLVMAVLLLSQTAQALTIEPPLPNDCKAAEEATDPDTKVNLYTRCLDRSNEYDRKLAAYQRNNMHFHRANALFELHRYAEALADYNRFIDKTSTGHVWALHQRGLTHQAMGHRQLALRDFKQALKYNPNALEVRFDRSQLFAAMGLYKSAIEDLRVLTTASPMTAEFANALAWLLATCPDARLQNGNEAVSFALKAASIDRNARYLDTLAAAQARKGDFKPAVETQQAVLDKLTKEKAAPETIEECTARLSLYKAGKAYTQKRSK